MKVYKATNDDLPELLDLCLLMYTESSYNGISICQEKINFFLKRRLCHRKSFCNVLKREQKIIGFFIAEIQEFFFSNEEISVDQLFFIKPEFRKSIGASKLLLSYINWAKNNDVSEIMLSSTTGVELDKVEKMYRKIGFKKSGVVYKLKLERV